MSNKSKIVFYKILVILSATMIGIHGGLMLFEYKTEGIISDVMFFISSIIAMLLILLTSISQWKKYYRLFQEENNAV